jgi:hypothetical protein
MLTLTDRATGKRDVILFVMKWMLVLGAVFLLTSEIFRASDPEKALRIDVDRCLANARPGLSVTMPCTGKIFDVSLSTLMQRPENQRLEVASMAPISEHMMFGSSGTIGFVVLLRERH